MHALGSAKAEALPEFSAFSGADITGRFAGKGKQTYWQALGKCTAQVVCAFVALGSSKELRTDTERTTETFVCQLHEPGTTAVDDGDLGWKLSTKKQLEAQKLPPTQGASHESIARAHYQALVWYQDDIPHLQLQQYGWREKGDRLVPVPTRNSPAPATITHLIKCGCKKASCRSHCSCRPQHLNCSEMYRCDSDEEVCSNVSQEISGTDDDEDDDDEFDDEGDPSIYTVLYINL